MELYKKIMKSIQQNDNSIKNLHNELDKRLEYKKARGFVEIEKCTNSDLMNVKGVTKNRRGHARAIAASLTLLFSISILVLYIISQKGKRLEPNLISKSPTNVAKVSPTPDIGTEEPLILVKTKGKITAPYVNEIWGSTWIEHGWLASDGMYLIYLLSVCANELPVLIYSEDFSIQYKDNISFNCLSIFNDSFERIQHNVDLSYLNELSKGTYYISIEVIEQGKYIEDEKQHELRGYECAYKLIVQ